MPNHPILCPGLDFLRDGGCISAQNLLRSGPIGLLTNHTGCTQDGQPALEVLRTLGADVRTLFSPEHGLSGQLEGSIASSHTPEGLPVYSLHGETRRPTHEMLDGLRVLVCDLQDVGARFYTYATTLAYAMEECAQHNIAVIVLDRPNPLGGETCAGPMIDDDNRSFVGYLSTPTLHGMTLGELTLLHRAEKNLDLDLQIVPAQNWRRTMQWPQTNLRWIAPSPNLPDYQSAAWYPGLCLLEFSGVSVGRGTIAPFQILGAPWLEPDRVLRALQKWPQAAREGIHAQIIEFIPTRGQFADQSCRGLHFTHDNEIPAEPLAFGMALLSTLYRTHSQNFGDESMQKSLKLLGSSAVLQMLRDGEVEAALEKSVADDEEFKRFRPQFWLEDYS